MDLELVLLGILYLLDFTISQGVRDCDDFVPNALTPNNSEEFILHVTTSPNIYWELNSESGRGGWKTQGGGGKHIVKPIPKNVFGPPHLRYVPPPLFGDSLSSPLKERGTDQTNPNF